MKLLPLALLLAATACNSESGTCLRLDCLVQGADAGPSCSKDSECALGNICASSHCTAGCRSGRDCPVNQTCDPGQGAYGKCVSNVHPDGGPGAIDASVADARPGTPDASSPADAALGPDGCAYMEIPVLVNGNFDNPADTSWTLAGNAGLSLTSHSPPFSVKLGTIGLNDAVTQSFTIPSDAVGATLSGYYHIVTSEPGGSAAKDIVNFEQQDFLGWTVFYQASNQDASAGWVPFSTALNTPFLGGFQFLTGFQIVVTEDATNATTAYVDDLSLTATVCR